MKNYLLAAIGISVLALSGFGCALLLSLRNTVAAVPGEIADTRSTLVNQVQALRLDSIQEIDKQATAIRKDAFAQLAGIAGIADRQLTGARSDLKQTVAESVKTLIAPVEGLRTDLQPVIAGAGTLTANAATLTKDAQDSWDDMYPDVRSLVQSAEVTSTQVAQAAEVVRANTPKAVEDVTGIASDFHDATHSLDVKYFHPPPRNKKQKVGAFFSNFEALLIAALRGGVI